MKLYSIIKTKIRDISMRQNFVFYFVFPAFPLYVETEIYFILYPILLATRISKQN